MAQYAQRHNISAVYFRFASHAPLLQPTAGLDIIELDPRDGFEPFIASIHQTIKRVGRGGYYIFDCLTDLAVEWYSDQMLGNLFMLTCPRLYDVSAIAYFALFRNQHSRYALTAIMDTTQILIDVLEHKERLYIHPKKVQQRYSPSMYNIHAWGGKNFTPLTKSGVIAEIQASTSWGRLDSSGDNLNIWNRSFMHAEETRNAIENGNLDLAEGQKKCKKLLRMAVCRDEKMLNELENAYDYPVDIEFTVNFSPNSEYSINIAQCRPFQWSGSGAVPKLPENLERKQILLESHGAVVGKAREVALDRLIYVDPKHYTNLSTSDKYTVARVIGRACRACADDGGDIMLLGPGCWVTSTPSLGVPVNFSEIGSVSVLCEIVAMHEGLVPDVSLARISHRISLREREECCQWGAKRPSVGAAVSDILQSDTWSSCAAMAVLSALAAGMR